MDLLLEHRKARRRILDFPFRSTTAGYTVDFEVGRDARNLETY